MIIILIIIYITSEINYKQSHINQTFFLFIPCSDDVQVQVTGDKQYTLDWPEYGLKIDVPNGSLPPGCRAELQIKSIVSGNFILPPDCHLVSSIYWISCPERFKVVLL